MTDMDGVLVHEGRMIPGADAFIARLRATDRPFLVLTNNSIYTQRDLQFRLRHSGIDVPVESIWTSALATASFLADQRPNGSAYVIGEAGLTTALHEIGYILTTTDPDYVVLGETRTYSFEAITTAIRLIKAGARFVATNPDPTGPSDDGILPATGAIAALMTRATGVDPYFVGQTQPAHDAGCAQPTAGTLGDDNNDRRPDGHRHRGRARSRHAHRSGAHRHHPSPRRRPVPLPPEPDRALNR
jgi:NagD protein